LRAFHIVHCRAIVRLFAIAVAGKRTDKGGGYAATRTTSAASAFVVRQQTQHGHWLRLRVTLTTFNTSSGRLILCLNNVIDHERTSDHWHNTRPLNAPFTDSASTPQTTSHCEQMLPVQTVESSTTAAELHTRRPAAASQLVQSSSTSLADIAEMKVTPSRCAWVASRDVQLAWAAGTFDVPATDRHCSWQMNGKRSNSVAHAAEPYDQHQPSDSFVGYQDDSSCHQLHQLLNCDSSYMISTHQSITHVTNQPAYVDLITMTPADRNTVYESWQRWRH